MNLKVTKNIEHRSGHLDRELASSIFSTLMTNGPPPSSAGPSQTPQKQHSRNEGNATQNQQQQLSQQLQNQSPNPQYPPQASYYPSHVNQPWQHHHTTWQVPLTMHPPQIYASGPQQSYQYASAYAPGQSYIQQSTSGPIPNALKTAVGGAPRAAKRSASPSPPPSPPLPEFHRHWDAVIANFLSNLGMTQALRGFENDMLVVNEEWERQKVPKAIGDLMRDLMASTTCFQT